MLYIGKTVKLTYTNDSGQTFTYTIVKDLLRVTPAIQATGLLTISPAGLPPAEHASLRWTHNHAKN